MNTSKYYNKRQLEIVEFSERVYHEGLRHKGLNGSLYEDFFITYLRSDLPELDFYKGQILTKGEIKNETSAQYDIIVCKKGTEQKSFLDGITSMINLVSPNDVRGVIELKKWANPKMINRDGVVNRSYQIFKKSFPNLDYLFVCLRFKDRITIGQNRWHGLNGDLEMKGKYCFYGNVDHLNKEWVFPWTEDRFERYKVYMGEYERLIRELRTLIQK